MNEYAFGAAVSEQRTSIKRNPVINWFVQRELDEEKPEFLFYNLAGCGAIVSAIAGYAFMSAVFPWKDAGQIIGFSGGLLGGGFAGTAATVALLKESREVDEILAEGHIRNAGEARLIMEALRYEFKDAVESKQWHDDAAAEAKIAEGKIAPDKMYEHLLNAKLYYDDISHSLYTETVKRANDLIDLVATDGGKPKRGVKLRQRLPIIAGPVANPS